MIDQRDAGRRRYGGVYKAQDQNCTALSLWNSCLTKLPRMRKL